MNMGHRTIADVDSRISVGLDVANADRLHDCIAVYATSKFGDVTQNFPNYIFSCRKQNSEIKWILEETDRSEGNALCVVPSGRLAGQ